MMERAFYVFLAENIVWNEQTDDSVQVCSGVHGGILTPVLAEARLWGENPSLKAKPADKWIFPLVWMVRSVLFSWRKSYNQGCNKAHTCNGKSVEDFK